MRREPRLEKVDMLAERRQFLARAVVVACTVAAAPARGQESQPVRLVTPYPAGGPADVVARAIAQPLAEELGRPVVVDNRAGASGTIGAGAVARSAPDGTMLLFNTSIQVALPHLMKLPYDTLKDFTPIGQINSIAFILVVNKDLPFRTLADLVAFAKAHPGKLNYATNSAGGASHLAAEQFKKLAGIDIVHVPYKGSAPAITDLIGGQVQLMFEQGPSVSPFLKAGQLRALAVSSPQRSALVPDIPTFVELGFPFTYSNWQGIWAPGRMPEDTAARLSAALQRALQQPALRARLVELGTEPSTVSGSEFRTFVEQQYEIAGSVVRSSGMKLD